MDCVSKLPDPASGFLVNNGSMRNVTVMAKIVLVIARKAYVENDLGVHLLLNGAIYGPECSLYNGIDCILRTRASDTHYITDCTGDRTGLDVLGIEQHFLEVHHVTQSVTTPTKLRLYRGIF